MNKMILLIVAISFAHLTSKAGELAKEQAINEVTSATFTFDDSGTYLEVLYGTGGCDPKNNNPAFRLEHVSTVDITAKSALEQNPTGTHEYLVTMKVKLVEPVSQVPTCAMAYDITHKENLTVAFRNIAAQLGIDLVAKKAHYDVNFLAPQVSGGAFFSAF